MSLFSPIHHTFAPHVDRRFVWSTLRKSWKPWSYKNGPHRGLIRIALSEHFHAKPFLFSTGREALLALLQAMNIKAGEEIIIQGYTCVVLPNAIHAAGGTPVYADIDQETLNIDCDLLEEKITSRTRAIICQHTFGIPADTVRLRKICDAHNIALIEDCAHVIPDTSDSPIGKHGDHILLSFGRDKALSGITGGAMLTRDEKIAESLQQKEADATDLSIMTIDTLLRYPLVYSWARPWIGLGIGKLILAKHAWLGLFPRILTKEEKQGHMPPILHKMPDVCAALLHEQWKKLKTINDHRRQVTKLYLDELANMPHLTIPRAIANNLPLQKFPVFTKNATVIRGKLKKKNIHLNDGWTGCVVCPVNSNLAASNYQEGSDPHAEAACDAILSLPTHPTMTEKQAHLLIEQLKKVL